MFLQLCFKLQSYYVKVVLSTRACPLTLTLSLTIQNYYDSGHCTSKYEAIQPEVTKPLSFHVLHRLWNGSTKYQMLIMPLTLEQYVYCTNNYQETHVYYNHHYPSLLVLLRCARQTFWVFAFLFFNPEGLGLCSRVIFQISPYMLLKNPD